MPKRESSNKLVSVVSFAKPLEIHSDKDIAIKEEISENVRVS